MKYAPSHNRPGTLTDPDDLVDVDDITGSDPLPDAPKDARADLKARLAGRPFPLDPRVNEFGPNIARWIAMVFFAWLVFRLVDPATFTGATLKTIAISAALFGTTLGGVLFARGEMTGEREDYFRTHQFLLISMFLALLDWVPRFNAFAVIGPMLVGFGAVSALGVVVRCIFPKRTTVPGPTSGT